MVSLFRLVTTTLLFVLYGVCTGVAASSINDIEHIVVFMQENRAFDHYYGKMKGVRGFNDRSAPKLAANGENPFYQPTAQSSKYAPDCLNHGCTNEQQSQICNSTAPGSEGKTWVCCFTAWVEGKTTCPPMPPAAKECKGATTQQECLINTQPCPAGSPGAGPKGNRCCGGWWNDDLSKQCPPPGPEAKYMLPYHVNLSATSGECMAAPAMSYPVDIGIFNDGKMDSWNTARGAGYGMGYFERADLPYYYALGDGFTVGDQHYQSTFTQTCPNRMHLFSGSNNNLWDREKRGSGGMNNLTYMMLDNDESVSWDWPTVAETLEEKNVSWKVYMEEDNFDDNGFAWFTTFRDAKPGNPLYDKGLARVPTNTLVDEFEADVKGNKLPQVSWLIAPANQSEHATNHPSAGEALTSRLLKVLQENPDVYAKTAFILNYDEGGQFYDHLWSPTPPVSPSDGESTVETLGEITTETYVSVPPNHPIGMGYRVPLMIISPWTRVSAGGAVYSEVVDHTSVIRFIEERFGVHCPNISPWRRAVCGDLVNAFDFDSKPDYSWPALPDTSTYIQKADKECSDLPSPEIPSNQSMPSQEPGTKLARPLPYNFLVQDSFLGEDGKQLTLRMQNVGGLGAVFFVYDYSTTAPSAPRKYTIEAKKELNGTWEEGDGPMDLSLHGPNGFVRKFSGDSRLAALVSVEMLENFDKGTISFFARPSTNLASFQLDGEKCALSLAVEDNAYGFGGPWKFAVDGSEAQQEINVSHSGNWYDFSIVARADCESDRPTKSFTRRFMGKMETGKATITDPAMGNRKAETREHLPVPRYHRFFNKTVPMRTRGLPKPSSPPRSSNNLRRIPTMAQDLEQEQNFCPLENKDACGDQ